MHNSRIGCCPAHRMVKQRGDHAADAGSESNQLHMALDPIAGTHLSSSQNEKSEPGLTAWPGGSLRLWSNSSVSRSSTHPTALKACSGDCLPLQASTGPKSLGDFHMAHVVVLNWLVNEVNVDLLAVGPLVQVTMADIQSPSCSIPFSVPGLHLRC